ncbi:MAG TPA: hypothetical protein VM238_20875 [Phycisphaerae bacterium]|nr:hypothetical protein [Phycisphaerae bacterium]
MALALGIVWLVSVAAWAACAAARRLSIAELFHMATPGVGTLLGVVVICNMLAAVTVILGQVELLKRHPVDNVSAAVGVPLLVYLWVRFVVLAVRRSRSMDSQVPRYRTGEEVRLGDRVIYAGSPGRVVFVVGSQSFSQEFPGEDWEYLGRGFMLETEAFGLVHPEKPDENLHFVERA